MHPVVFAATALGCPAGTCPVHPVVALALLVAGATVLAVGLLLD